MENLARGPRKPFVFLKKLGSRPRKAANYALRRLQQSCCANCSYFLTLCGRSMPDKGVLRCCASRTGRAMQDGDLLRLQQPSIQAKLDVHAAIYNHNTHELIEEESHSSIAGPLFVGCSLGVLMYGTMHGSPHPVLSLRACTHLAT